MARSPSAILALLLALGAAACDSGGGVGGPPLPEEGSAGRTGTPTRADTILIAGLEANDHGSLDVSGMTAVELGLDDVYFQPTILEGEAGQTLTIGLKNEGDVAHTFTITELDIDAVLQPGEEAGARVTFPSSGAIVFFCRFHETGGMRGALSVGGDLSPAPESGGSGGGGGYGGP